MEKQAQGPVERRSSLAASQRLGLRVFAGLGVLTAVEYVVAAFVEPGSLLPLTLIAIGKAWLILRYFMHVAQIWSRGEEHDAH